MDERVTAAGDGRVHCARDLLEVIDRFAREAVDERHARVGAVRSALLALVEVFAWIWVVLQCDLHHLASGTVEACAL
jgi:hypothetical protein